MYVQYGIEGKQEQKGEESSQVCAQELEADLAPFTQRLDAYLDRRIVGNLIAAVAGIVQTRADFPLSELGSTITSPEHAEAGKQRLERALLHQGWQAKHVEEVLWEQAERGRQEIEQRGETPLCVWASLVLEKAESQKLEGLGKVRESLARRLARSRPGVFNRPAAPIMVRGFEWEGLLVVGKTGGPQVAALRWWSRDKGVSGEPKQVQAELLRLSAQRWGRLVRHVFDRGYGHGPWLAWLWHFRVRFVLRWMKGRKLLDASGQERKAWEIARGKRAWGKARLLWDTHIHALRSTRVLARPLRHPEYEGALWLVVVRQGNGREPWYLLTNELVETEDQAWEMAVSYVRRGPIEEYYRFQKCELLIETLRVQGSSPRRKLLLLVSLAYGYLLHLLSPPLFALRGFLLDHWWKLADWRLQAVKVPLYRLRWALSRLWLRHPPHFCWCRTYRSPTTITWPVCSLPWWSTLWHLMGYSF